MKPNYSGLPKWKRDFIAKVKKLNAFIEKLKQLPPVYLDGNLAFPPGSVRLAPIRHRRGLPAHRFGVN